MPGLPLEIRQALARVQDRTASETDLQKVVMRYALDKGWRRKHDLPCRMPDGKVRTAFQGDPGFPDFIAVRRGVLVIAEFKREKGHTSDAQDLWLRDLTEVPGVEVHVWRPRHWPAIKALLR